MTGRSLTCCRVVLDQSPDASPNPMRLRTNRNPNSLARAARSSSLNVLAPPSWSIDLPWYSAARRASRARSAESADVLGSAHGSVFAGVRPAATMVVVAGLLDPRWRVEIEAEAIVPAAL